MKRFGTLKGNKILFDVFFLAPGLVFFIYIVVIPFLQGIPYSFTDWNLVSPKYNFVGWRNYLEVITNTNGGNFMKYFVHTLVFTVLQTVFCNILGLIFALFVHKSSKFNSIVRVAFFLPFVLSALLSAYIWQDIYANIYGPLFNTISPLAMPQTALGGISFIAIWNCSGYCMVIFIAALQSIPQEYVEAAKIDGANSIQRFFNITLRMIVPAFTANVAILMSWGFKVFDIPMAATHGGPGFATQTIAMYAYDNIFTYLKAGVGQASAVIMVIMLAVITLTVSKLIRSQEVEL